MGLPSSRSPVPDGSIPSEPGISAHRLIRLQAAAAAVGTSLDLQAVLSTATDWAVTLVDAGWGVLALWDAAAHLLRVATSAGARSLLDTGQAAAALGEGLAGRAAEERRALGQPAIEAAPTAGASPPVAAPTLIAIPLLWQDDLLGVLEVGTAPGAPPFTGEDLSLLVLLGRLTAAVIANARLFERARQRLHQLTVLQNTSRAIISQLDYDQALQTVLRNATSLFATGMGAVFVPDARRGSLSVRTAVGLSEGFVRDAQVAGSQGYIGRVLSTRKPVAVYDLRAESPADPLRAGRGPVEFCSILAVPLIHQGQVLGALSVCSAEPRHWSPADAELLLVFASQAASAMQNALLFEHLRAEKATLVTTLQSMSDGLVVTDADGCIILANPVADQLFKVPFTASTGADLFAVMARSPYPYAYHAGDPTADLLARVLGQGQPYSGKISLLRPEPMTLEFNFLPIIGAGYIITGGVAVFHDITELHRLNELKTDFISMVSHELRTPLTSIKGFVKLVLVGELGPVTAQQYECLAIADREADRLSHLINDLLDNSRIDAGHLLLNLDTLAPAVVVAQVVETLQPQAAELQLRLETDLPPTLPAIRADPQRLTQILTNLLGNAIKFTPAGGLIQVSAAADSDQLVVQVADTGEGIPAAEQAFIFDRFYQVERKGSRTRGGTGLGLAIAKQLVELHGGKISVTSIPDKGTTFIFTLPLVAPP